MKYFAENNIWQALRLSMSFIMLWAFFDKLFGLGFATAPDKSWLLGVSPTTGFLSNALDGVFASLFNSLAGNPIVDILFMSGLFLVGLSLFLGIGMRVACCAGALMMFLIYLSLFPPENNPIIDEHVVYTLIFIGLSIRINKQKSALGEKWVKTGVVKKYPILE